MQNVPRRHHYIPRFLQEGFASSKRRRQVCVWQYRTHTLPIATNTVNVAVERYYHFSRRIAGIESRVGAFENRCSKTIRAVREGRIQQVSPTEISHFFRHFALRLPVARRFTEAITRDVLGLLRSAIQQSPRPPMPSRTIHDLTTELMAMVKDRPKDPEGIRQATEWFTKRVIEDISVMRENQTLDAVLDFIDKVDLPANVRELHSEAIFNELAGIELQTPTEGFVWSVRQADGPLILGDIGPLAICLADGSLEPIFAGKRIGRAVLLAIDHKTWLIGSPNSPVRHLTAEEWNDAVARFSDAMFIANQRCDQLAALSNRIGIAKPEFSLAEIMENNPEFATMFAEAMKQPSVHDHTSLMVVENHARSIRDVSSIERYFKASKPLDFENNGATAMKSRSTPSSPALLAAQPPKPQK